MPEQVDAQVLDKRLKDLIGYDAHVEVTENGAINSAEIIVDLEDRLLLKTTTPKDLQDAVWPTLQLLTWYKNAQRDVAFGKRSTVEDKKTLHIIAEKLSTGSHPKEEIKEQTKFLYVADPRLGATKAMEILQKFHALYPDVPLKLE